MKTPACIGIENIGGRMVPIISNNSDTPIQKKITAFTNEDYLENVMINVLFGNNYCALDNVSVGTFLLKDIPPLPKSKQQIEISAILFPNMLLNVSASAINSSVRSEMCSLDLSSLTTSTVIERSNLSDIEEMFFDVLNLPSPIIGDSHYLNDLPKVVNRFYFNKAYHESFLNKSDYVLKDYSLTNEQIKALEILKSSNLFNFPIGGVIEAVQKVAYYYHIHQDAIICSTCNGFGLINIKNKLFGSSFIKTKTCPTCGGNCCVSINQ